MQLRSFLDLLSPTGQMAIEQAQGLSPTEKEFLTHFTWLNRQYPAELARAALETAILRSEARVKFPYAERMYFTRPALEQASSHTIATYRAQRFKPLALALDLGCSIGGDSLALAQVCQTIGMDLDPLRLAMARANRRALSLINNLDFLQSDLKVTLPIKTSINAGIFFDPARRNLEKRLFSVKDYQPPLEIIQDWLPDFPALGVKISPGVRLEEIQAYEAEIEFISVNGDLKEAVLWFGPLRTTRRRATLLPGLATLSTELDYGEHELQSSTRQLLLSEPRAYLYEPDPAVLRAGLVEQLGLQLGAAQLDADIAYLTTDQQIQTPFARSWAVEAWFPFQLKRLRAELRLRQIGRVTIKKRGSPLQPEVLIQQLRLEGDKEGVVFLTHLRGRPIAIIARIC
jgi:hypothetical protein